MKLNLKLFILTLCGLALLFIFGWTKNVEAATGDCHASKNANCYIPTPTTISPVSGQIVAGDKITITGLTWKGTRVKVFVDGQELKNVRINNHVDRYADFSATASNLTIGKHEIYTIAISENKKVLDQSLESTHTIFEVVAPQKIVVGSCHLEHCLVPTPTIITPFLNQIFVNSQVMITGLTWRTTIVKVFVDGQELKNVKLNLHEDYYADFSAKTWPLTPGKHNVYAIAYSEKPGNYDQSFETLKLNFIVAEEIMPTVSIVPEDLATTTEIIDIADLDLSTSSIDGIVTVTSPSTSQPVSIEPSVENDAPVSVNDNVSEQPEIAVDIQENVGKIEGGVVSEETNEEKDYDEFSVASDPARRQTVLARNRVIGGSLLFFLLLWFGIAKLIKAMKTRDEIIVSAVEMPNPDASTTTEAEKPEDENKYWANPKE